MIGFFSLNMDRMYAVFSIQMDKKYPARWLDVHLTTQCLLLTFSDCLPVPVVVSIKERYPKPSRVVQGRRSVVTNTWEMGNKSVS